MAVVSIPHNDPWIVARWAFRRLLERASVELSEAQDRYILVQAVALDGLHFAMLERVQAERIAIAMEIAADKLRLELIAGDQTDPLDAEFADALALLGMRLHDVHE